jgi:hypothetical protein
MGSVQVPAKKIKEKFITRSIWKEHKFLSFTKFGSVADKSKQCLNEKPKRLSSKVIEATQGLQRKCRGLRKRTPQTLDFTT